jgi:hypothetical protein
MKAIRRTKHNLVYLGVLLSLATGAQAAVIGCNTDGGPALAVNNAHGAYCVTDFGWSNTWYTVGANGSPIPSVYDRALDLFSGDDAVNLSFDFSNGSNTTHVTGNGWLSPLLDAGALAPFFVTGSPWQSLAPVHYVTPGDETATESQAILQLPDGVIRMVIDTNILPDGKIRQFYTVINEADGFLTNIRFADYFNFHPNGSLEADSHEGTTRFDSVDIKTTGNKDLPSFITDARMRLIDAFGNPLTPTAHDIGCADVLNLDTSCASSPAAIPRVQTGGFNNLDGPFGPGDFGGTLAFDVNGFEGNSFTIGVEKEAIPAPAPLALLGLGLLGLGLYRRTSKAASSRTSAATSTPPPSALPALTC